MTTLSPSSYIAATGRHSILLRLSAPSSRCVVNIPRQRQYAARPTLTAPSIYRTSQWARCASSAAKRADLKPNAHTEISTHSSRAANPSKQGRLATTSSSYSTSKSTSVQAAQPSDDDGDAINPPVSTRPASIDVPARGKDQNFFSYALATGKAYLRFYKTGIKNVWRNRKHISRVRAKVKKWTEEEGQRHQARTTSTAKNEKHKSLEVREAPLSRAQPDKDVESQMHYSRRDDGQLSTPYESRSEYQLYRRAVADFSKIPAFALLLAVFGEWLPLFVIFLTPLVPYPCRIPRQIRQERAKLEKRRSLSFRAMIGDEPRGVVPTPRQQADGQGQGPRSQTSGGGNDRDVQAVADLNSVQLRHACRSLNLFFPLWDTSPYWPPYALLRRRLTRRLAYLRTDDLLMASGGGFGRLRGEEIRIAAEERGIDILNREDRDVLRILEAWGREVGERGILPLVLSRPSVWAPESSRAKP